MSARIQDFDISEVDMPDHGIVNVKAIKDVSDCPSAGMLEVCLF